MEETRAACEILDSGKKGRRKDVDLSENLGFLLYISLEEESHKLDSKISWQLADFATALHFKFFLDAHYRLTKFSEVQLQCLLTNRFYFTEFC